MFKLTVNIPMSLRRRATRIALLAQITGELAEISPLTDVVRVALADQVARYEKAFNGVAEFPAPKALRRGRR